MGISLEEDVVVLPFVKLPDVGDWLSGHIYNMEQKNAIDQETKKPKLKDNGEPRKVLILSIIVAKFSDGALLSSNGENFTPTVGTEARIFIEGATWQWWIEAKKNHKVEVGDVVRWKFDDITPNRKPAQNDFKNRRFTLRKPTEEEATNVLICEDLYRQATSGTPLATESEVSTEIDF